MSSLNFVSMPNISDIVPSADQFERIETKFLAYRGRARGIESLLNSYLEPVDGTKTLGNTLVESIYLDTPHLDFYTSALMKVPTRLKMRIRKYLNTGETEIPRYLELKLKDLGISKKKRFRISEWEENELNNGDPIAITSHLETLNFRLKRESLYSRVEKVNRIIANQHPQFAVKVNYERKAYEGMGLRVTLDENLTYKSNEGFRSVVKTRGEQIKRETFWQAATAMDDMFNPEDFAIIEVKHGGIIPDWLRLGFKHLVLLNDVAFSKYTWCMTQALLEEGQCQD